MTRNTEGFTIIEILVALLILGIFLTVLSMSLTGSMKMNRDSQRQLNTASDAQRLMEEIRASWNTQTNYDAACAPGVTVPEGYTVQFINLGTRAEPITQANIKADPVTLAPINSINTVEPREGSSCAASSNALLNTTPANAPVMRKIIVQTGKTGANNVQVVGPQDVRLTLDVLRP